MKQLSSWPGRDFFLGEGSIYGGYDTAFPQEMEKQGIFTYILKGGPGCGKSTLMRQIAEVFCDREPVERYFCSSDPHSLDAVVLTKSKVAIVDGTAPHGMGTVHSFRISR